MSFPNYYILFFILFISHLTFSQDIELNGALLLGQSEAISYKLVFQRFGTKIRGYSITDQLGSNETRALIIGSIDTITKRVNFKEIKILKTISKSKIDDFCLMDVKGKYIKRSGKEIFEGKFTSSSKQPNIVCDPGTLVLASPKTIFQVAKEISQNIDLSTLSDSLPTDLQKKVQDLKSLQEIKEVYSNDMVKFDWISDTVRLEIWDDKIEDKDRISITKTGTSLGVFEVKNKPRILKFPIADKAEISLEIHAISEGIYPPNTCKIYIIDGLEKNLLLSHLKKNEKVFLKIKKN